MRKCDLMIEIKSRYKGNDKIKCDISFEAAFSPNKFYSKCKILISSKVLCCCLLSQKCQASAYYH